MMSSLPHDRNAAATRPRSKELPERRFILVV
jgi:hypothetical protein